MNSLKKIFGLILIIALFSSFTGPVIAGDFISAGGYFSTDTSISVKGTVNETIIIQQITKKNGSIEKTQWISSQVLKDPTALSWNSKMTVGLKDTTLWWDFKINGLPMTWNKVSTIGKKGYLF